MLTLLLAAASSARAQQHPHDGGVTAVQPLYDRVKDLYIKSAELMPEEHYAFRPAAGVRTYGEIMGHVAEENYLFCSTALGEANPNTAELEKLTGKANLVRTLRQSFAYCDGAYRMPEMRAMEQVTFFGNTGSRLWVLIFNVTHDSEHYGNIVTYLRMKGLVPPSSQGGM
ncbi:MAG TPA: DinB family protein [Gemmatimonadales bacterium]